MKRGSIIILLAISILLSLNFVSAFTNESVQAKNKTEEALDCIKTMQAREIPVRRANDSYQEALQIYEAQIAKEEKNKSGDYASVLQKSSEVCKVAEKSFEAADKLEIFKSDYSAAQERANLSSMETDYNSILRSFSEERFEDTIQEIDKAYSTMSEIEKSQTTLKLFYESTRQSIKKFFIDNWKKLTIIAGIVVVLLIIFWRALLQLMARRKLRKLEIQRETLNNLIAKMQKQYFSEGKISELEFNVRLGRYHEMIRDIDRQIPLIKEEIFKLGKEKNAEGKKKSAEKKERKITSAPTKPVIPRKLTKAKRKLGKRRRKKI